MALTKEESVELARLLRKAEWPLDTEVFRALVGKTVTTPIELEVRDGEEGVLSFYRKDKVVEVLNALGAQAGTLGPDGETIAALDENSRAEDLSVDQFVEAFKRLGPPPGVLPRPGQGIAVPEDLIGGSEGDVEEDAEG